MGYTAGTLDLSILGDSDSAVASIDRTVKSLNSLSAALGRGNSSRKSFGGMFKNFFKLTRWTAVLYATKRIGSEVAKMVDKGSDFGETLNLWKVAMGKDFLPQATEFVNKLNEAYGISKETLMNSQAIFKNMLGSLGQISGETAYQLSEGITQMALDYASLYNVKFEDAMTKFQAALAGQVRPIRSVSGYDITENTLFQLYEQLGGTKTMRQLSRTEKQLLAIYAVFEQMGRSGATGDLKRTINSFANQSRVFADSWKEVQTYAGLTVTRLLEQYNVMKYVNAVLIFMSRILEGLATSLDTGLGNSGEVFGDMENGVNATTEALEDLQNALLDFDKFRALDQTSTVGDTLGIDETILNAMTRYDSILANANLEARNLADSWLKSLGLIDENNDGIIDMQGGIQTLFGLLDNFDWGIVSANLSDALIQGLRNIRIWLENFDWQGLGHDISDFIENAKVGEIIAEGLDLIGTLAEGITEAIVVGLSNVNWFKVLGEIIITPLKKIFDSLLYFFTNYDVKYPWADYSFYANGGLPDKGTMFVAGEAGAEMVYNMPSGQSGVANVQQIAQATYSGTMRALNDWWGGSQAKGDIPQLKEANATGMYQAVTGVAKSQGKVWANV